MMNTDTLLKYYTSTPYFEYYINNPDAAGRKAYRWDRGDCVIRAMAKAAGITWLEAYDFLAAKGRRDYAPINDAGFCRKWWKEAGATWVACKAEKGKKRMTAREFAETHPTGSYIVDIAHHNTAVVNGKIYDSWNCGDKAVVGYYDMAGFNLNA